MTAEAKLREATLLASRINRILLERHPVLHDDSLLNDMRQIIAGEFEEALEAERREALEEAALLVKFRNWKNHGGPLDYPEFREWASEAIRALASRAAGEGKLACPRCKCLVIGHHATGCEGAGGNCGCALNKDEAEQAAIAEAREGNDGEANKSAL